VAADNEPTPETRDKFLENIGWVACRAAAYGPDGKDRPFRIEFVNSRLAGRLREAVERDVKIFTSWIGGTGLWTE
jgi:hypothetical protein